MALDVGDVRIGVAMTDPMQMIASPRETVKCTNEAADLAAVAKLAVDQEVVRIVVGLPLNQHGERGPQAEKILAFTEKLRPLVKAEIVLQDERFSTAEAQRMLIAADVRRDKRKQVIDKVAAANILQSYLDRRATQRRLAGEG